MKVKQRLLYFWLSGKHLMMSSIERKVMQFLAVIRGNKKLKRDFPGKQNFYSKSKLKKLHGKQPQI